MPIFRRIPDFYSCIPDSKARILDSMSKNVQDIQGYSLTRGDMLSDFKAALLCVWKAYKFVSIYCMLNIFCYFYRGSQGLKPRPFKAYLEKAAVGTALLKTYYILVKIISNIVTYSFSAFAQKNVLKYLVDGTKFTIRTLNKQLYIYI